MVAEKHVDNGLRKNPCVHTRSRAHMHSYVQTTRCPISEDNGNQSKSGGNFKQTIVIGLHIVGSDKWESIVRLMERLISIRE